jgi:intracellular sulfur oxidation DsrE/DsrF family protein
MMTKRRQFLAQLGVGAAAMAFDADELKAAAQGATGEWDISWIDRLATAQYRVVFNASDIAEGLALDRAATFLDHFHDIHGTKDAQTRPVVVFRANGTGMAFNDAMWDRYAIGDYAKVKDPATKAPARRNIFWKAPLGASAQEEGVTIETLHRRGMISLVCNVATNGWGFSLAERAKIDAKKVQDDLRANLVPGAILMPSGVFALIRAQNAGCAYMPAGSA